MRAPALKIALALIAAACASAFAGYTVSAYSSAAGSSGSTFQTAASYNTCPNTTLTGGYVTGLEYGRRPYAGDSLFSQGTGVSVDAAVARTGSYSLKIAAAAAQGHAYWWWVPAQPTPIVRFALRMDSLPAGNVAQLLSMTAGGGALAELRYVAATQKLALAVTGATGGTPVVATASSQVTAGAWHVVEIRYDVSTASHVASWQIDEVSQPPANVTGTATGVSQTYFGTRTTTDTYTAYYDDIVIASAGSQYPLGDGRVRALAPNAMGTHSGAANFTDDDGTAIDANSWQRLDESPLSTTTDFIQQTGASGTSYAEIAFADTTETCIRAVHGYISIHSVSSNQANSAKVSVFDASTESIIKSGNFVANNTFSRDGSKAVSPATAWSQAALNGLVARFGYAADNSPTPILDGILLEYEVPQ